MKEGPLYSPAQELQEQEAQEKPLLETLGERRVGQNVRLAISIIDSMDLSGNQKFAIFLYHFWHESGSFIQVKEYTELREDPFESIVGKITNDDHMVKAYGEFYNAYEKALEAKANKKSPSKPISRKEKFLQQDSAKAILNLKIEGLTNKEISLRLAIPLIKVNQISDNLVLAGAFVPKNPSVRTRSQEYRIFCDKVIELRKKGIISHVEIASMLNVDIQKVKKAVIRLSQIGEIKVYKKTEIAKMIKKRRIKTKRTIYEDNIKEKLRSYLRLKYSINPKGFISLAAFSKELRTGNEFNFLKKLYEEIAQEESVPPRSRHKLRQQ